MRSHLITGNPPTEVPTVVYCNPSRAVHAWTLLFDGATLYAAHANVDRARLEKARALSAIAWHWGHGPQGAFAVCTAVVKAFTMPSDVVIDPLGVATIAIACLQTGRDYRKDL